MSARCLRLCVAHGDEWMACNNVQRSCTSDGHRRGRAFRHASQATLSQHRRRENHSLVQSFHLLETWHLRAQHWVCVECEESGLSATVDVIFDQPRTVRDAPEMGGTETNASCYEQFGCIGRTGHSQLPVCDRSLWSSYKPHRLVRVVFDLLFIRITRLGTARSSESL
jgi:hypothetical protein